MRICVTFIYYFQSASVCARLKQIPCHTLSLIYAPKVILKSVMRKRKLEYSFDIFSFRWFGVGFCMLLIIALRPTTSNCYHITCLYHFCRRTWSILNDYCCCRRGGRRRHCQHHTLCLQSSPPSSLIPYNHAYRLPARSLHSTHRHTIISLCLIWLCSSLGRDPFTT